MGMGTNIKNIPAERQMTGIYLENTKVVLPVSQMVYSNKGR
jgi:hypothetical protein